MQPQQDQNQQLAQPQPVQQQPTNTIPPTPAQPQDATTPNARSIKAASRSNIVLACFVIVISGISAFGINTVSNKTMVVTAIALYVILSIVVLLLAAKLKPATDITSQKSKLLQIAIISLLVVMVSIISSIVQKKSFIGIYGLLYMVNFVYVLIVRSRLKI